ncbi:MAG: DMT family transporter [Gammaproteobacteria bacterium]|jgi:drug/metabolite transporter (DMT)-like permease|nr:DMT family transporter [Gammaproteobacteria bacterium]MBU0772852.1 DMT family transporter [Gammaproteobacteria bacterium]MBU0855372.1 DMT family transporter [Gammaproteobacteria bacterium]MBU1847594.1 DMT family transporter [Gammaproteobacteria bacterium]
MPNLAAATASPRLGGYLAAAGTVAIWTGFILISRLGGVTALTPYDTLALRLGTASLLLLPFLGDLPRGIWFDLKMWVLALLGGLIYGVFVFAAFKFAPAAHGAILLPGMQPFLIAAVAWALGGARPDASRMIGLAGIAVGIVCVAAHYVAGGHAWTPEVLVGDALLLGGSLAWAIYSVLAKRWAHDPWTLTRFVALASTLLFMPVYLLWLPKGVGDVPLGMLVAQGLYQGAGVTLIAMMLFLKAVHSLGAERTGALVAMVPVLAGVAAAPLLGEALSGWLIAGLLFVSAGAFVAARPGRRRGRRPG